MRPPVSFVLQSAVVSFCTVFALGWLAGAPFLVAMGEASELPDERLLPYILKTGSPILLVAILFALHPLLRHGKHARSAPHTWTYGAFALTVLLYLGCWVYTWLT